MTVALDTAMMFQLQSKKNDLEYKIERAQDAKATLVETSTDLLTVGKDLEPDSPVMKSLQQRKEQLQALDRQLDENIQRYQLQLQMTESRLSGYQNKVSQGIQQAFSVNY